MWLTARCCLLHHNTKVFASVDNSILILAIIFKKVDFLCSLMCQLSIIKSTEPVCYVIENSP